MKLDAAPGGKGGSARGPDNQYRPAARGERTQPSRAPVEAPSAMAAAFAKLKR
jgi:hypothetical protein